ncbi:MAG: hypothetical protein E7371_05160 [Clostridiales bacterium]|nr:hypothetical protein [Clostridiales bacterium]
MRILSNKKCKLIRALTAVFALALSIGAVSVNLETTASASTDKNEYVMDATQVSFVDKGGEAVKDENDFFGVGHKNNYVIQTALTHDAPSVKVQASGYGDVIYGGDNDIARVEVKLLFNRWPDSVPDDASYMKLSVYNSADIYFENPIASAEEFGTGEYVNSPFSGFGNFIRIFQLEPEDVCNNRGKLRDFVLRAECDGDYWNSALIIDYVKVVFEADGLYKAGECLTNENPENITDTQVVWTKGKGFGDTYIDLANYGGFFSYVDNPMLVELTKDNFPTAQCVTEADGTETLLLKNAVFALNVGDLSADDYQQFTMDILLNDKRAKGGHTLYLYGSKPGKFLDENGAPVGYAAKVLVESYEQGFHNKFLLEKEDISKLADKNGNISYIYVLYQGNTLDTAEETVGLRNGSQIWINKVQFLKEGDVETPTVATEYDKYDVSDIFPVGESVSLNNKAGASVDDIISIATLQNKRVGELSLDLTMENGENIAFLFNAKTYTAINEYKNGGVLFYLSNDKIEISARVDGEVTKSVSATSSSAFDSKKTVKLSCIPYYLNDVESGLYCAVTVDGQLLLSDYFRSDCLNLGDTFHLSYQAKDKDFSVNIASAKTEGVISAKDLMKVEIKAETLRYSLDKTDIPLVLAWYNTGCDEVSKVNCSGDVAMVNQDVRRVQFTENGEVKVSFSVTNAFGTFTSNELSVKCKDVLADTENLEQAPKKGCAASIIVLSSVGVVGMACGTFFLVKKNKASKKEEVEESEENNNEEN